MLVLHNFCHLFIMTFLFFRLCGTESVSYTHLDVYKRQHNGHRQIAENDPLPVYHGRQAWDEHKAVSYTHLDVYKRQVQDIKKSSLTFAPEAGSQRLRDVINKGLTEDVILSGARQAFEAGWNRVKLYFMLGLPTETVEDMEGIALLSEKIAEEYYDIPKEQRHGKVQVVASSSFFVPKPFTPFQWARMCTKEEFLQDVYKRQRRDRVLRSDRPL